MFRDRQLTAQQHIALMGCLRMPGRIGTGVTAALLGFEPHDIAVLILAKLLTPLGKPSPNAPKYFASVTISAMAQDAAWLSRATRTLTDHWRERNKNKNGGKIS